MAIIKNHFYNIVFSKENMMKVFIELEKNQNIYPQLVKEIEKYTKKVEPVQLEDPYSAPLDEVTQLMDQLNIDKEAVAFDKKDVDIQSVSAYLKDIEEKVENINNVIDQIDNEKEENKEAITLLNHLKKQDLSLDEIHELQYISLRFGRIPVTSVDKIHYYQNEHFILRKLESDDKYIWVVYCALNKEISEIDNIFSAIDFHEIAIPEFAHGKFDDAIAELKNERAAMEEYIDDLQSRVRKIRNENKARILAYFCQLTYLKGLFTQSKYIAALNDKLVIYAFTPYDKNELIKLFNIEGLTVTEHPVHLYYEKGLKEPIILKNSAFVRPFESLIKFKNGDSFDPTTLIAIVMMLSALFLIGDLGTGVVLILISVIIKGKYSQLLQRLGLFVLIGGLLNATIFYQQPLYQLPLAMPHISTSVAINFVVFVMINLVFYWFMMIMKNVLRKKAVSKGGV